MSQHCRETLSKAGEGKASTNGKETGSSTQSQAQGVGGEEGRVHPHNSEAHLS